MPRSSRKTKKRQFHGNRWTKNASGTVNSDGRGETSTSAKKIKLQDDTASSSSCPTGYRFVDVGRLVNLVCSLPCKHCKNSDHKTVTETFVGLASTLCFTCVCGECEVFKASGYSRGTPDVNIRFAVALMSIGRHYGQGQKFLANMNIPAGPSKNSWTSLVSKVHAATRAVAQDSMQKAGREVKDCSNAWVVSCDGKWQRRGFASKNGICTVLRSHPSLPSKVLDVEMLSNHCQQCSVQRKRLPSDQFELWYATHKLTSCSKNHDGSAGAMEPRGMSRIFARSESVHGLKYTGYLGDGDSKSYSTVAKALPYGPSKPVEKLECCGHVQKRMGKRLMDKASSCKGKVYKEGGRTYTGIGGSGKGKLTKKAILKLQGHYGAAIRSNAGDLAGMKKSIWASYKHRSGNHADCGDWCPAVKCGDLGKANANVFLPFVLEVIKPVYEELTKDSLLLKCVHGGSQNSNESLHNMIWARCPKTTFVGRMRMELGAFDAVICFNDGESARVEIFKRLGVESGDHCVAGFRRLDCKRIANSSLSASESVKKARKDKRLDTVNQNDDDTYIPGGF